MDENDEAAKRWSMESLTQEIVSLQLNSDIFPEKIVTEKESAIKEQIRLFGWTTAAEMLKSINLRQEEVGQRRFNAGGLDRFFPKEIILDVVPGE